MILRTTVTIAVAGAGLLFIPWWYVKKKYSYFRDRGILHDTPTFPMGNVQRITAMEDFLAWGYDLYMKFRGQDVLCGMYMGLQPVYVLTDLDVIEDVLVRDFKNFTDHKHLIRDDKCLDPLGPTLYSMRGELWRNMRTKMSSAYSCAFIEDMFEMTQQCAMNLKEYVDRLVTTSDEPINAQDICVRYLCDAVGSCGFGIDCRGMVDEDPVLLKLAHKVFNPNVTGVMFWIMTYPYLLEWLPSYLVNKDTREFLKIIDETVKYREEFQVRRNDILQVLLDINRNGPVVDDESGEILGEPQPHGLHAEAFQVFFFNYHTTRNALNSLIYELATNEEIQQKVREEIQRTMAAGGTINYATIEKMVYLQQVINETLRKHPGVGGVERTANEDYITRKGGHKIKKGELVFIPIWAIHNDPNIYPDPTTFNPDRMSLELMNRRHKNSFIPFSIGPRACPAHRLVYLQLKLAIVSLLGNYRLSINIRTKRTADPWICNLRAETWLDMVLLEQ